jgi:hypothetical protein
LRHKPNIKHEQENDKQQTTTTKPNDISPWQKARSRSSMATRPSWLWLLLFAVDCDGVVVVIVIVVCIMLCSFVGDSNNNNKT